MQTRFASCAAIAWALLSFPLGRVPSWAGEVAYGRQGMVATVHAKASEIGVEMMKRGGNAVDGAVAAGLMLGVVDGHNSGIGGGCFLVIRLANGAFVAIDGRETAPALAARDMYMRDGKAQTGLSQSGALAIGVPGALAAYAHAVKHYGKLPLEKHLEAAAETAERGFRIDRNYAQQVAATARELGKFPAAREIFFKGAGQPLQAGDLLKQPDLARTYRGVAQHGTDWFYGGPFARATEDWMKDNGGLLRIADFEGYEAKERAPVISTYRGYQIAGFPPPSSGGVHVAQILNILESFDLKAMGAGSAEFVHVVAEAMKLAFADRAYWLGDPEFAPVPRGLITREYAAELAKRIRKDKATPVPGHGTPPAAETDLFKKHTTHFSAADAQGNWVACTATINTSFGSKVVIPRTGVMMNNEMDDFSIQPGVTNYFGLVGAEANAVAPGKRPLSSMSPTIVLKDGEPVLALGASGGPTIISQTLLTIIFVIDFGMPIDEALAQSRFHHQWRPDELRIEQRAGAELIEALEKRGHQMRVVNTIGVTQVVGRERGGKRLVGAHDPRRDGAALGF